MKKVFLALFVIALGVGLTYCGSSTKDTGDTGETTEVTGEEAPAEDVVAKPSPDNIDISKPFPVADLFEAYFAWKDKEVTVVGYGDLFFDTGKIGDAVKLTAVAGDKTTLVEVTMTEAQPDEEDFPNTTPLCLKGKIKASYWDYITLIDGSLVSKGDSTLETVKPDPFGDLSKPMNVKDFFEAYGAWEGKEVTIVGNYWGTTTSVLSSGDIIRVDISDPVSGTKMAGCEFKENPGEVTNRENRTVKGIIDGESFDMIKLVNCEFVN